MDLVANIRSFTDCGVGSLQLLYAHPVNLSVRNRQRDLFLSEDVMRLNNVADFEPGSSTQPSY